jgi:HSP20 family protein
MANVTVRKQEGQAMVPVPRKEWDPMVWARDLWSWDPFRQIMPSFALEMPHFNPTFDVKELPEAYLFRADVPGVTEKEIEVLRAGTRLTINGKRETEKEDKGETYYTCERSFGSFSRTFTLPDEIDGDAIHADLKDGVLTVVVPKKPGAVAQKIAVTTPEKKS